VNQIQFAASPSMPRPRVRPCWFVGSLALDTIETQSSRARGRAGRRRLFTRSFAASFFAPVRLVGVVGSDFSRGHEALLRSRSIDLAGLERSVRPPPSAGLAVTRRTFNNSHHPRYPTPTSSKPFRPKLPPAYADSAVRVSGQHRSGLAVGGAGPGAQPALCGVRHHELLDRRENDPSWCACWSGGEHGVAQRTRKARQLSGKDNLPTKRPVVIRAMGPGRRGHQARDAGALFFLRRGRCR